MRVILGMILGAILTIAGAYSYDVFSGKMAVTQDAPANAVAEDRPMVNWDVVERRWRHLETNLREMAARVQEQWSKRSG